MGMPITVDIVDMSATAADMEKIFSYFTSIDEQFSPYKKTSELTRINDGKISEKSIVRK